jgi:hypothetical protein
MAGERKKLLSMICSPATTVEGIWQYFFTECQPDMHLSELFDNAITSADPLITSLRLPWYASEADKQSHSDQLNKSQRARLLRDHPFLSARLHALQQTAFWDFVLKGKHQPLGEILDWWRRVEFQEKGTPHSHNLICIRRTSEIHENSLLDPNNAAAVAPVLDLVRAVSTARLQPRLPGDLEELPMQASLHDHIRSEEQKYNYTVDRKSYFADHNHPCRVRFTAANRSFNYDAVNGTISDTAVQSLYRRLQLANQLHACRGSCYKYCKWGETPVCRYEFPKLLMRGNFNSAVIISTKDRRSRMRIKVEPPRNNGNLNVSSSNPLIVLACRGNHDIQYMANSYGGAEYVSKYAAKTDTVESKALQNAISRKLATATLALGPHEHLTLRQTLRAVGNAVISSQQIGTVHACYVLSFSNHLVQSSRVNFFVNATVRRNITAMPIILDDNILDDMEESESALSNSPSSQLGKRDAYHAAVKDHLRQHSECDFDFYAFLSSYRISKESSTPRGQDSKVREGLKVKLCVDDKSGLIVDPYTFTLNLVSPNCLLLFYNIFLVSIFDDYFCI